MKKSIRRECQVLYESGLVSSGSPLKVVPARNLLHLVFFKYSKTVKILKISGKDVIGLENELKTGKMTVLNAYHQFLDFVAVLEKDLGLNFGEQ